MSASVPAEGGRLSATGLPVAGLQPPPLTRGGVAPTSSRDEPPGRAAGSQADHGREERGTFKRGRGSWED